MTQVVFFSSVVIIDVVVSTSDFNGIFGSSL